MFLVQTPPQSPVDSSPSWLCSTAAVRRGGATWNDDVGARGSRSQTRARRARGVGCLVGRVAAAAVLRRVVLRQGRQRPLRVREAGALTRRMAEIGIACITSSSGTPIESAYVLKASKNDTLSLWKQTDLDPEPGLSSTISLLPFHHGRDAIRARRVQRRVEARAGATDQAEKGRQSCPRILRHRAARVPKSGLSTGRPVHPGVDGVAEAPLLRGAAVSRAVLWRRPSSAPGVPGSHRQQPPADLLRVRTGVHVQRNARQIATLLPAAGHEHAPRSDDWLLRINADVEPDS